VLDGPGEELLHVLGALLAELGVGAVAEAVQEALEEGLGLVRMDLGRGRQRAEGRGTSGLEGREGGN
jgi:hypothetical protein